MVKKEEILGLSLMFIGFTYLLSGIGLVYLLITVGSIPGMGTILPQLITYIIAGWFFAILTLVTGFITLIAGVAFLVKK